MLGGRRYREVHLHRRHVTCRDEAALRESRDCDERVTVGVDHRRALPHTSLERRVGAACVVVVLEASLGALKRDVST